MPHAESHIVATWADTGKVHIYDLTEHVRSLDTPGLVPPRNPAPIYTVDRHGRDEGYGLDWSALQTGHLITGDTAGRIFLTIRTPTTFQTDAQSFQGHTDSVEDLQWCPTRSNVFASASVDQTIKIWDARTKSNAQLSVHAHDSDVNVISWHKYVRDPLLVEWLSINGVVCADPWLFLFFLSFCRTKEHLLASGSDSGVFSIWDLRMWPNTTSPAPAATYKWHQGPITSIEWAPHESSAIAVAGADDQLTLWDFGMERDEEEAPTLAAGVKGEQVHVPPQLMFIHQGQKHIKELHYHPQADGVLISTALDGFNIFKTINS